MKLQQNSISMFLILCFEKQAWASEFVYSSLLNPELGSVYFVVCVAITYYIDAKSPSVVLDGRYMDTETRE